jgi:hypothetical protein
LNISHRLAKLMNGSMAVASKLGKGSLFQFDVALDRVDSDETPATPTPFQGPRPAQITSEALLPPKDKTFSSEGLS